MNFKVCLFCYISLNKLKEIKKVGINRLSVGTQSFNNQILSEIGRLHSSKEIYQTIENIKLAGFENFSIDLMYGLPKQNVKLWQKTLDKAINLNPSHISLYGLKIEEGSYYFKYPPANLPSQDIQAEMYELAIEKLSKKYIHYEFSNFASKEKYFSKHNSNYWKNKNYYGFGLSASGYIKNKRYTNTFNFGKYIKNPLEKDYQVLTKKEQLEEEIFLGLRLLDGINFEKINQKYNVDIYKKYQKEFDKHLNNNLIEKTDFGVKLNKKGILLSNEILCDFITLND